jgi:hypothetical protein
LGAPKKDNTTGKNTVPLMNAMVMIKANIWK